VVLGILISLVERSFVKIVILKIQAQGKCRREHKNTITVRLISGRMFRALTWMNSAEVEARNKATEDTKLKSNAESLDHYVSL
jgi:hypothetical protein